ncbi:nitrogen assimilation transcription factor nirA [Trichoderma barbatum]
MSERQTGKRCILARSCEFCRIRKVRCSAQKPSCKECVYIHQAPKARAMLDDLQAKNERLREQIRQIKETGQVITPDRSSSGRPAAHDAEEIASDVSPYLWTDEGGNVNVFGKPQEHHNPVALVYEHRLRLLDSLDGVLMDLVVHLPDLHWNRQHHPFLLTYRPALMRDIAQGGRFLSKFLLNAIFACAGKFSCRLEALDDPGDPTTAGGRFFKLCDELMTSMTTKARLLTGAALRMVYDFGPHLNHKITLENAEEIEIYRRPRDAHVSHKSNDIMEENEPWAPYIDPISPRSYGQALSIPYGSTHPVYCFQQLCLLFKIVSRIIDDFYVVGATLAEAMASLEGIDTALIKSEANLPNPIQLGPSSGAALSSRRAVPNILALHIIYNAAIILLHRPLLAEGHLNLPSAAPTASWRRCTVATRNITNIAQEYRSRYSLRPAPYLISYGVLSAIGGRDSDHSTLLICSLRCLEELPVPNSAVSRPITIIQKLMEAKGVAASLGANGTDCPNLRSLDVDALPPQNVDAEDLEPSLPLFDAYAANVLYGFMGSQSRSFGDIMPEMMGIDIDVPVDDSQNIS